jgi:branched-chain amino acid transport system substrate-binding protein
MQKIVFFLIGLSVYMIGCKEDCNCPNDNSKEIIKIGVLIPQTGSGSSIGEGATAAIDIAMNDIDTYLQSIDSKYSINFRIMDTGTDPSIALIRLEQLKAEGISLVIGPFSSSAVAACKDHADQNDVILLSPASVSRSLSIPDDNIFRLASSDSSQAVAMAEVFEQINEDIVIFPLVRNDIWGNDLFSLFKKEFEKNGGEITEPIKYDVIDPDFSVSLSDLSDMIAEYKNSGSNKKPVVYMLSYGEGVDILKIANEYEMLLDADTKWFGSSAFANNKNLLTDQTASSFALSHSLRCPIFGLMNDAEYKWRRINDILIQSIGRTPEVYSFLTYDAAWIAALSYFKVGNEPQFSVLKESIVKESDMFFGSTGQCQLDRNGDRSLILYDIWGLEEQSNVYNWKRVGQYEGSTGKLWWF